MTFYTYILFSTSKNKYYVGSTSETLQERIRKHNSNHQGFTGKNADWVLKYFENYSTKTEALIRKNKSKTGKAENSSKNSLTQL